MPPHHASKKIVQGFLVISVILTLLLSYRPATAETLLGYPNFSGYCVSLRAGWTGAMFKNTVKPDSSGYPSGWFCVKKVGNTTVWGSGINANSVCKWHYSNSQAYARLSGTSRYQYSNWRCFKP